MRPAGHLRRGPVHEEEVVELALWFGPLARPGIRRAATVIGAHGIAELTSDENYEPDQSFFDKVRDALG